MKDIMNNLFIKRQEEIHISKEEQEKILKEPKIYLHTIISSINDKDIQHRLLKYEEQNNKLNAVYDEIFYKRGFKDAITLLRKI